MSENKDLNLEAICFKLIDFIKKANDSINSIQTNDKSKVDIEKSFHKEFIAINAQLIDFLYYNSKFNLNLGPIIDTVAVFNELISTSSFKLLCIISFISEALLNHKLLNKLSAKQIELILKCCQIQLSPDDYFYNGDKYGELFYVWRNLICSIIKECLSESMLNANISSIQLFYEFSVKNLTNRQNYENPYKYALEEIKSKFKTKSIYFNLLDKNEFVEEKIPVLIHDYYQSIKNDYIIDATNNEFKHLVESKNSNGSFAIAERHYKKIFESLFSGFIKASNWRSRQLCFETASHFLDSIKLTNLAKSKEFQIFLIEEIIKLTKQFSKETNTKLDENSMQALNRFLGTYAWNQLYSQNENNLSFLVKPCLQLIINCFQIETNDLKHVEYMFRADRVFNLANYSTECIYILDELIRLSQSNANISDLSYIYNHFIDKVQAFKKVIEKLQPILFDKVLLYSIENQAYDDNMMRLFTSLTNFNLYPKEKDGVERFTNLLSIVTRDDIFDSFQADVCTMYQQPALFYFNFFYKLAECIDTRADLLVELKPNLLKLLEKIKNKNEYYDLFLNKSNGSLINYHIVYHLSNHLALKKRASNTDLIICLIQIWISIKDQDLSNETNSSAVAFFQNFANNYPDELSEYYKKIFDYFLTDKNSQLYLHSINQILPIRFKDLVQYGFCEKFHEKILNSEEDYVYSTISTLGLIMKYIPQYLIEKQDASNQFNRLFDLINISFQHKENKPELFASLFFLFLNTIEMVKSNQQFYRKDFFLNRDLVKRFLEFVPNDSSSSQYLSKSLIVDTISSYYKMLSLYETNYDLLFVDLVDLIQTNKLKEFKSLFQTLKEICLIGSRIDLLIQNKSFFSLYKHEVELSDVVCSILDLCEGRSLEVIDSKLDKNVKNLNVLETNLNQNENLIRELDQRLTNDESKLTNLNVNVKNINEKLDEFGNVIMEHESKIEEVNTKTLSNVPKWGKKISEILNKDWILVAQRLNYKEDDIRAWLTQSDPCMCMLQEWFITNKTSDAINGFVKSLKSINQLECIKLIETDLNSVEEKHKINNDFIDTDLAENSPDIFISFEWSSLDKANLIKNYLRNENFANIWFDDGNMGGGIIRNKRIDIGLRKCRVLVCLITDESSRDETCLNQINLAVQLNKPIIPLLLDSNLKWPPSGSLGPILSEYLFIRFFQRPKEVTNDERFWPVDKFNELIMQLKALVPIYSANRLLSPRQKKSPQVFISYQWDKQKQIIKLFNKFKSLEIDCWLDIYEMGGGDSLYDKIDRGIRNCLVIISCITKKYSLSANCRKEIALADSISKPIIPILLEEMSYPPSGPMAPILGMLKYVDFISDLSEQDNWNGDSFKKLLQTMKQYLPKEIIEKTISQACILS